MNGPFWIGGPWPGKLAIVPRPRGGDWLEDEVRAWRQAGLNVVVSVLTSDEVAHFDLVQEKQHSEAAGIEYLSFPIVDRSVPSSEASFASFVRQLDERLATGKAIGIHCRQGIGRSALVASALLVGTGQSPEAAFEQVSKARGVSVPETTEQRQWIMRFAEHQLQEEPQ